MAIFDKIPFLKKKEEFADETGIAPIEIPTPAMEEPIKPVQQPRAFQQQGWQQQNTETQLILAKLDAIKASLDALNQRVANLERIAGEEETGTKGKWY